MRRQELEDRTREAQDCIEAVEPELGDATDGEEVYDDERPF
jgi:hypothetical protein